MRLGLRIDVDTYRGTTTGVPLLLKILNNYLITASFFFSVGPDNMGRNLWRLLKPAFLKKMLRSNAPGLYGWDILFRGTLWPGTIIGKKSGDIIRHAASDGHEIGLHAWDHYKWQASIKNLDKISINRELGKGFDLLENITGFPPACSAAPGWICNNKILLQKEKFPFTYNSDCRGESIFYPVINGKILNQPQIPVTLPTYDEVIGNGKITRRNYNDYIISLLKPDRLNVLTIHAEVEGIICLEMFEDFIKKIIKKSISIIPLKDFLKTDVEIKPSMVIQKKIKGREGMIAMQSEL